MACGLDFNLETEVAKIEQESPKLVQKMRKKIFSEFYRKVGFWEIKNGESKVSEKHLRLIRKIPNLYKSGLFPFIDFMAEFIANDRIATNDELEVAVWRFQACSDGLITREEFSDWCTLNEDKKKFNAIGIKELKQEKKEKENKKKKAKKDKKEKKDKNEKVEKKDKNEKVDKKDKNEKVVKRDKKG